MECEGSVPEFSCVYQRLVSLKGRSRPSLTHLALEYINGTGLEARRLSYFEKTHLQSLSSPFHSSFGLHQPPPPLLVLSYYLLLLFPPHPISFSVLRPRSPPPLPLQKEAFLTVTRTRSRMDRDHIVIPDSSCVCAHVCV